ncbi:MAG: hypothetical protein ABSC23_11695 [Bryobacteraceae bacterium]|jgi:hypothetical protein
MNIQYRNCDVATVQYQADRPLAFGRGFDIVALILPLRIDIRPEPNGQTWLGNVVQVDLLAKGRLFASGWFHQTLSSRPNPSGFDAAVEFHCTPTALAEYERLRYGGPVELGLRLWIAMHELEQGTAHRRILSDTEIIFTQDTLHIDKQKWINALRAVGLSVSVLVEVPFAGEPAPDDEALKALFHAVTSFENGGPTAWKDCVGHIRPYLEIWKNREGTAPAEPKDGSTADRIWKLLNYRDALYKCCHFWVHQASAATTRDDALLALCSYAALLRAYRSSP